LANRFIPTILILAPKNMGTLSDHFDGHTFFNHGGVKPREGFDLIKWLATRTIGEWKWKDITPGPKPKERVGLGECRVTFVNHATVLVQTDGFNILTDPVWSERASPFQWAGPKRHHVPGIRFEDLPPIDVVLLSHNHYDHLDIETLQRLSNEHHPKIYTGLGNTALLAGNGILNSVDMDWDDALQIRDDVKLTCVPVQHFSGRGLTDRNATLWCGFVVESPAGVTYFAGDSGYGPHFKTTGDKFGPVRLALLPIGAYRPEWFMAPVHVSPAEAVQAHQDLRASTSVAIHFGTFPLADDGQDEPVEKLNVALTQAGIEPSKFWVMTLGEGRDVPAVESKVEVLK
jgi:L-ascorbate metabolism protein UlaG (beta-lactamase superfamily)